MTNMTQIEMQQVLDALTEASKGYATMGWNANRINAAADTIVQAALAVQPSQARELSELLAKLDAKAGSGFIPWEIEDAYAAYVAVINAKGGA